MSSISQGALHLICDRSLLLAAIQAADAVVPSNSTKPILTNLLLDGSSAGLEIIATDSQVSMRARLKAAEIIGAGQAVVAARQLALILKESASPSATLLLEVKGETSSLRIQLADGDYQVPVVVGEAFPSVSFFPEDSQAVSVSGPRFEEMLRQTSFAMDKDRTSAVLSGLSMVVANGELILAATDGKVLAEAVEKNESYNLGIASVVPSVTIGHLQRILSASKPQSVDITFSGKLVFLRLRLDGGLIAELTSRLVDGSFPAYRNAMPGAGATAVTFKASDLATAVRRAALMTSSTSRGVVMNLDRDQAVFTNLNYANGSARIPVPCQYQGSPVRLGLNSQYFSDVLRVYKGENIGIELGRGMVMREPGSTYLVMPISLPS